MSTAVNRPVDEGLDAKNASELSKLRDLLLGSLVGDLEGKLSELEVRLKAQSAAQAQSYEVLEAKMVALEGAFLTNKNETERRSKKEFSAYSKEQTEAMNHLKSNIREAMGSIESRLESLEKHVETERAKKIKKNE